MKGLLKDLTTAAAISIWVGALFGVIGSLIIAVLFIPHPLALTWLALMVPFLAPYISLPMQQL